VVQEASAGLAVQGALAELELVRVEAKLGLAPAAELVPGRAEAELERDPEAVPLRNKSVTAARHRGPVLVLKRVEDLAVVAAATMRGQAATEAGIAWAAAVTAVAAAPE
jgi:hypothetical protein